MRVVLKSRRKDAQGAVAVMVAILMVVLVGISAFALDLGLAYSSKRQLQTAADAGALAAASVYAEEPGTCDDLVGDADLLATATATADDYADRNRPESDRVGALEVACNDNDQLTVKFTVEGETDVIFAGVLTDDGTIRGEQDATALVYVPGNTHKLRPYGLCDKDVPAADELPSDVVEIKGPGQAWAGSDCPAAQAGGNWWFTTCPGADSAGMSPQQVAAAIINGCPNNAEVVEPQNPSTPGTLSTSLTANCNGQEDVSPSCLDADTGNSSLNSPEAYGAWGQILGETILLPVFCSTPTCSPSTVDGSGTNRVYPVFKIAPAIVCGYHIYDKGSAILNTGDCAGHSFTQTYVELLGCSNKNNACLPNLDDPTKPFAPKEVIRLFLKFVPDEDGEEITNCGIGDDCDAGLRRSFLVE